MFIGGPGVRIVTDIGGRGMSLVQPLMAAFPISNLVFIEINAATSHGAAARGVPVGVGAKGRPLMVPVFSVTRTPLLTDLDAAGDRLSFSKDIDPDELSALKASALGTRPKPGGGNRLVVKTEEGDDVLLALSYVVYGLTYRSDWREPQSPGGYRRAPSALAWT
jgi:hypothetical protein